MKKLHIAGVVTAGIVLLSAIGASNNSQTSNTSTLPPSKDVKGLQIEQPKQEQPKVEKVSVCDGITVTANCTVDNVSYKTYIYHEAVPERSHTEQETTYEKQVSGYCTLCNDDTYSPSCATGRGACSYHGGVAQWNAPRYRNVPVSTTKTIVDSPAQAAYYEKVTN